MCVYRWGGAEACLTYAFSCIHVKLRELLPHYSKMAFPISSIHIRYIRTLSAFLPCYLSVIGISNMLNIEACIAPL